MYFVGMDSDFDIRVHENYFISNSLLHGFTIVLYIKICLFTKLKFNLTKSPFAKVCLFSKYIGKKEIFSFFQILFMEYIFWQNQKSNLTFRVDGFFHGSYSSETTRNTKPLSEPNILHRHSRAHSLQGSIWYMILQQILPLNFYKIYNYNILNYVFWQ